MKKLIISICTLALATALLGASTFAWFSMNRKVDVSGMQVTAKSASSLVITTDALPTQNTDTTLIDFDVAKKELFASTHTSNYGNAEAANYSTYGLVYYADQTSINPNTGLNNSSTAALTTVPVNTESKTFYVDYTVYICAVGETITGQDLEVRLTSDVIALTDVDAALSIDFYCAETTTADPPAVNATTYKGTLNLGNVNIGVNSETKLSNGGNYTPVTSKVASGDLKDFTTYCVKLGDNISIPKADSASPKALAVTLRVYLDGALLADATHTVVRNAIASTISDQELAVRFDAINHVTVS